METPVALLPLNSSIDTRCRRKKESGKIEKKKRHRASPATPAASSLAKSLHFAPHDLPRAPNEQSIQKRKYTIRNEQDQMLEAGTKENTKE
jgi:hypothetical protein